MIEISKIRNSLLDECIGNPDKEKALAFVIRFKSVYAASVMKNYSLRKLAQTMGIAVNTLRRYLDTAIQMGLMKKFTRVVNGKKVRYLRAFKIREIKQYSDRKNVCYTPKWKDTSCPNIAKNIDSDGVADIDKIKNIKLGVKTVSIVRVCTRKAKIQQLINDVRNPGKDMDLRVFKAKRRKLCQSGYRFDRPFVDNGITYEHIKSQNRCGNATVKKMGELGTAKQWFLKEKQPWILIDSMEKAYLIKKKYYSCKFTFTTEHEVYLVRPCKYILHPTLTPHNPSTGDKGVYKWDYRGY